MLIDSNDDVVGKLFELYINSAGEEDEATSYRNRNMAHKISSCKIIIRMLLCSHAYGIIRYVTYNDHFCDHS